ncbi:MAG: UDP-N-acetylmuramoyl-L-alanyl-D-glutamate--2,6-diaminopimelate ligase, partial [Planctomycetes bacterium]|nr:UDP-N-acetylmuramoyl-L-alanyl-D-glutamate--2,6-diaminopimelate ligase [Planctomycetota bacterium]
CLNRDDPASEYMYRAIPDGVAVRTFGRHPEADFRVEGLECGIDGSRFTLVMPRGKVELRIPLVGAFNAMNAAAAAAAANVLGVSELTLATALETASPPRGRLEFVGEARGARVFVDYAHTADALDKVCGSLRDLTDGPLSVVFGCGGDRDTTKRPEMARVVADIADRAWMTSDNPRSEDPEAILDDMERGLQGAHGDFFRVTDRGDAIRRAIQHAEPGETVLVAGKGHEAYQVLGDTVVPFDDVEVARDALRSRGEARLV